MNKTELGERLAADLAIASIMYVLPHYENDKQADA